MTPDICIYKIHALRSAYNTEEELHCRHCEVQCERYQKYEPSMQIPIRHGIVASKLMVKLEE